MFEAGYFLNVNKPKGITSRDVVNQVSRVAGTKRVGHAGTLDPLATGVLVVAVGKATRLVEYVQQQPKTYETQIRLGESSDTDDVEGQITHHSVLQPPTKAAIESALRNFVGTVLQRPPNYSALKVAGKRAYKLAREGTAVELAPRPVTIYALTIQSYSYPLLALKVDCGSGTYIRSIARDLGASLGTCGLMSGLTRTAIGDFTLEEAVTLEELTEGGGSSFGLPLERGLGQLPRITVDEADRRRFLLGQKIPWNGSDEIPDGEVAVFDSARQFLGIATVDLTQKLLKPNKGGFVPQSGDI